MAEDPAENAGELNYQIFFYVKHLYVINGLDLSEFIIKAFVKQFLGDSPNYQKYNDMVGSLTLCHKEIKRRLNLEIPLLLKIIDGYDEEIAEYENLKIIENGDCE